MFFSQLILVGTGLLGASIGLAAKERNRAETVIGVDVSRKNLDDARKNGAIDAAFNDLDAFFSALSPAVLPKTHGDILVVVCTPVSVLTETVNRVLERYADTPNLLVTDVGSTKTSLCRAIDDPRFVGSHPIAGSEQSGPAAARGDLFQGRTTIVTPVSCHSDKDIEQVSRFWQALGSTVVLMEPEKHDEILAATSHLPHLLSVTLAATLHGDERPFTGSGFADMTRLAHGNPALWRDILMDNRENVLAALQRFELQLAELANLLEAKDGERVEAFLKAGGENRQRSCLTP